MASRRMFSARLINSAKFLKMPISSQALYFHLGMNADDDGVVEAFPVIRLVGCTEDDLRVLVAKNLVQVLNEDLVTYITDWNENNKIRADRKIDSIYKDLLLKVNPDVALIEKKPRADIGRSMDNQWTDNGQPMDGIGKDRLGKDSLVEGSLGKDSVGEYSTGKKRKKSRRFTPPTVDEVAAYIAEKGYHFDPEAFVAFYTSKNWMIGKDKMSSWKHACLTWEKRRDEKTENRVAQDIHRTYDMLNEWANGE